MDIWGYLFYKGDIQILISPPHVVCGVLDVGVEVLVPEHWDKQACKERETLLPLLQDTLLNVVRHVALSRAVRWEWTLTTIPFLVTQAACLIKAPVQILGGNPCRGFSNSI